MKPSRKSRAIELISILWYYARGRHWKCGYTKFEAATINHLHVIVTSFMFGDSGTQIYDLEVKAKVSIERTIEPLDL